MFEKIAALPLKLKAAIGAGAVALAVGGLLSGCGFAAAVDSAAKAETLLVEAGWPSAFESTAVEEPEFMDDASRTNNAFNVIDFGEQGKNGWFYRCGDPKHPERSQRCSFYNGESYTQSGAVGLEIKKNFMHTAGGVAPILEWRAAETSEVNISVTYVKNVNGDSNPFYPDGVNLMIYKGDELLKYETVNISTTEEVLAELSLENVAVEDLESLYFVVDPRANNAYDGGSLYVHIADVRSSNSGIRYSYDRQNNNTNNQDDFGRQGQNGWTYMYGTSSVDCKPVSHSLDGEFINAISPGLTISQGFVHPAVNHNAVLSWKPAVSGDIDLRVKYTKFAQNDGNPDFPDGVKIKVYHNNRLLYQRHVNVLPEGEVIAKCRVPKLTVSANDRLYFMVDAEGNSSYDGGSFDITVIDVNGATTDEHVVVEEPETRQNIANVATDFGWQGKNGWMYQMGYEDDPFNAYNIITFDPKEDRYFDPSYQEIKRDYVNPGEHGRSSIIKWRVAQNGRIQIKAAYTKMKNEDANPAWPDGTRVTLYYNDLKLAQQTFAPVTDKEVTKRLDVPYVGVEAGDYITMVINGLENTAYDGGKYEFQIMSTSGLVGDTEKSVLPHYTEPGNFGSVKDDFGAQGNNGWYYQYGYNHDPFYAVNIERFDKDDKGNIDKYFTADGVEIKRDFIVPGPNGKCAMVKWVAAEDGKVNVELSYTKFKNEDANPDYPDGVIVYLMRNNEVVKSEYFAPVTDKEVTRNLNTAGISVKQGDCLTMIVDPGKNPAYDAGKYTFMVEDADRIPTVAPGTGLDNLARLGDLAKLTQGEDGWWFLEGTNPANAKVLIKRTEDAHNVTYTSHRTNGLELKLEKDNHKVGIHTGEAQNPICQWVVQKDGAIEVTGNYIKYGHQDANPSLPDGVTVSVWVNNVCVYNKKCPVSAGDGNDNRVDFSHEVPNAKRGDKISIMVSADENNAWDAGCLDVSILDRTPDNTRTNETSLPVDFSTTQGEKGWYFGTCEWNGAGFAELPKVSDSEYAESGENAAYAKLVEGATELCPGSDKSVAYRWVAAQTGTVLVDTTYEKYGYEDGADGTCMRVFVNGVEKIWRGTNGDGPQGGREAKGTLLCNVKPGDELLFVISPEGNNKDDSGKLWVNIRPIALPAATDHTDNNANLAADFSLEQGKNGWYYGTCEWDGKNFTLLTDAADGKYYKAGDPVELKADFVHPGAQAAAYAWVAAKEGTIRVSGEYTKFANDFGDCNGTYVRILQNGEPRKDMNLTGKNGTPRTEYFNMELYVHVGDLLLFDLNGEGNTEGDDGKLSVTISEALEDTGRTNEAHMPGDFHGTQGENGWYYGTCKWNGGDFNLLPQFENGIFKTAEGWDKVSADHAWWDGAYRWVAAKTGKVRITVDYTKDGDGGCARIFHNGGNDNAIRWMGGSGDDYNEVREVQAGDVLLFAFDCNGSMKIDITPEP